MSQRNVFTSYSEIRQPDGRLDDATYKAWIAEGFEYKFGKFIRKHTEFLPVEAYKKVDKQAA